MATDTRQSDEDHRRFARFRPPQAGEGGTMSLLDHIRELRYRIIVSFIAVVITSSVAFVFYRPLVEIVMHPYQQASLAIKAKNPTASLQVVNTGVVAPFVLNMRVAIVAGLIAACPIWLYQVWAFIVPGLLVNEKKWALRFLGSAIPLFLLGSVQAQTEESKDGPLPCRLQLRRRQDVNQIEQDQDHRQQETHSKEQDDANLQCQERIHVEQVGNAHTVRREVQHQGNTLREHPIPQH